MAKTWTKTEVADRRLKVARLYLEGTRSCRQIAKVVGCSAQTVWKDLERLRKGWRQRADHTFDEAIQEEIAELDRVAQRAWKEWHRSRKDRTRTRTSKTTGTGKDGDGEIKVEETVVEGRLGDPRYLDIIKDCVAKRSRLRGLEIDRAELRVKAEFRVAGKTPDQINMEMLTRLAMKIQARLEAEAKQKALAAPEEPPSEE